MDDNNIADIWDIQDKIKSTKVFINSLDKTKYQDVIDRMNNLILDYEDDIKKLI
tara:strand:- start:531 stop:692 length:162 start_codon:yes stop_codon:yes gene_type:complete